MRRVFRWRRWCVWRVPALAVAILACGCAGMLTVPAGSTPDVWAHVYRVDAMLNGDVIARPVHATSDYHPDATRNVGGSVDRDVIAFSLDHDRGHACGLVDPASITRRDGARADVPFDNTAIYPPASYLPQLAALSVGRVLALGATCSFYLAELFMLAAYTTLSCLGLALIPRFRWLIAAIAIVAAIPDSFAFSPDSTLMACSLLLACLTYRAMDGRYRQTRGRTVAALTLTACLTALCKIAYAPYLLLPVVLMHIRHDAKPVDKAIAWTGCILSTGFLAYWLTHATRFATNPSRVPYQTVLARQRELLANPWPFIARMLASIARLQGFSWWEPPLLLAFWTLVILALALTLAAWRQDPGAKGLWMLCWVLAVACTVLVYLAVWMQFTPPRVHGIEGINSRYLQPLAPMLVIQCAAAIRVVVSSAAEFQHSYAFVLSRL